METTTDLTITTAARGAAPELFQHELRKVLANIKDPNTSLKKRKIAVVFTFAPKEDRHGARDEMTVSVQATSKLEPVVPAESFAFIGRRAGELVAATHDVKQEELVDVGTGEIIGKIGSTAKIAR